MVAIEIRDDTQSWRDLADQLSSELVAQLERAEELRALGVTPQECDDDADSSALDLHSRIARGIASHQAGVRFAGVPIPQFALSAGPWENMGDEAEPEWTRILQGPWFEGGRVGYVITEGFQLATDGSVEWGARVAGDADDWMEASAARNLADALVAAADAMERDATA